MQLKWYAGLAMGLVACAVAARSPELRDLSPVQVYPAPQVSVADPEPLPDVSGTEPMFSGMGTTAHVSTPDIPYEFFWDHGSDAKSARSTLSSSSPGLRGSMAWPRAPRSGSSWLATPSDMPWTLGASNWRYSGEYGLDVTLGNEEISAPAWGSSTKIGGISISQSSMVSSDSADAWQYSMALGALDYTAGQGQGDLEYGPTASSTVLRYRMSPQLTLESQLELASDLSTTGLGGRYETKDWGVWSAGVARASQGLYKGWRYQTAYQVDVLDDLQLSWLNERHTAGFADLSRYRDGSVSPGGVRRRLAATVPMGRWGDVSGVYQSERPAIGSAQRSFGLTQQFWYSPNLRIGLEAERELHSGDYDIGIQFSVPIY